MSEAWETEALREQKAKGKMNDKDWVPIVMIRGKKLRRSREKVIRWRIHGRSERDKRPDGEERKIKSKVDCTTRCNGGGNLWDFEKRVTDGRAHGPTDRRTDGPTDGQSLL